MRGVPVAFARDIGGAPSPAQQQERRQAPARAASLDSSSSYKQTMKAKRALNAKRENAWKALTAKRDTAWTALMDTQKTADELVESGVALKEAVTANEEVQTELDKDQKEKKKLEKEKEELEKKAKLLEQKAKLVEKKIKKNRAILIQGMQYVATSTHLFVECKNKYSELQAEHAQADAEHRAAVDEWELSGVATPFDLDNSGDQEKILKEMQEQVAEVLSFFPEEMPPENIFSHATIAQSPDPLRGEHFVSSPSSTESSPRYSYSSDSSGGFGANQGDVDEHSADSTVGQDSSVDLQEQDDLIEGDKRKPGEVWIDGDGNTRMMDFTKKPRILCGRVQGCERQAFRKNVLTCRFHMTPEEKKWYGLTCATAECNTSVRKKLDGPYCKKCTKAQLAAQQDRVTNAAPPPGPALASSGRSRQVAPPPPPPPHRGEGAENQPSSASIGTAGLGNTSLKPPPRPLGPKPTHTGKENPASIGTAGLGNTSLKPPPRPLGPKPTHTGKENQK